MAFTSPVGSVLGQSIRPIIWIGLVCLLAAALLSACDDGSSPAPTDLPTNTPAPNKIPTQPPSDTPAATPVPKVTPKPTATLPVPTPEPTPTRAPTATPTPEPTPTGGLPRPRQQTEPTRRWGSHGHANNPNPHQLMGYVTGFADADVEPSFGSSLQPTSSNYPNQRGWSRSWLILKCSVPR